MKTNQSTKAPSGKPLVYTCAYCNQCNKSLMIIHYTARLIYSTFMIIFFVFDNKVHGKIRSRLV